MDLTLPQPPEFKPIKYEDNWVRFCGSIVLSHFVLALGRDESFFELIRQSFYYRDLFSGFLIAFLLWQSVNFVNLQLDKRFDWGEQTALRLVLQVIFGVFLLTAALQVLTYFQYTYIIGQDFSETSWYENELPVCVILIILVNTYYVTYHFFQKYYSLKTHIQASTETHTSTSTLPDSPTANSQEINTEKEKKERQIIIVNKGQHFIPVPVDEIAYIFKDGENTFLKTFNNDTYNLNESLDDIFALLNEKLFFRANRQTILNLNNCHSYSQLEFGKLEVSLLPVFKQSIIISQKKAPVFKEWISR